jgi:hypothetical protein
MKTRFVLRIFVIAAMLALVLTAAPAASADTPGQNIIPIDVVEMWPGADNPCGFDIVVHTVGDLRQNFWVNESGEVTRVIAVWGTVKQTVLANDKSLKSRIQGPVHYELISGNRYIMVTLGTYVFVTVPGYGHYLNGAGQFIEEITIDPTTGEILTSTLIKQVGNVENTDDWRAICEYLSP